MSSTPALGTCIVLSLLAPIDAKVKAVVTKSSRYFLCLLAATAWPNEEGLAVGFRGAVTCSGAAWWICGGHGQCWPVAQSQAQGQCVELGGIYSGLGLLVPSGGGPCLWRSSIWL